jgi:hypothetical protein
LCGGENREKGSRRAWYISLGRCEEIPDPSEVSSLGKLRVFLISYNLITRNDIITDLGMQTMTILHLTSVSDYFKMMDNNRPLFIFSDKSYKSKEEVADDG